MAKMTIRGLDEYAAKLQKLSGGEADKIMKRAVYEGAGRMADKIRAAIQALPSFEPSWQGYKKPIRGVSDTQKRGLLNGLGISQIQNDGGFVNARIGFNGYNGHVTEKYPGGQPNAFVARSVESGSSVGLKTPFVRPAVTAGKNEVIKIMAVEADMAIKDLMK